MQALKRENNYLTFELTSVETVHMVQCNLEPEWIAFSMKRLMIAIQGGIAQEKAVAQKQQ